MVERCSICLQEMHNDIGTFIPCGHCIHVTCFKEYLANYQLQERRIQLSVAGSNQENVVNLSSRDKIPKCPLCLSRSTGFQKIFLSLPKYSDQRRMNLANPTPEIVQQPLNIPPIAEIHLNRHHPQAAALATCAHGYNTWNADQYFLSLYHLRHVAIVQHQTMLIQRKINMIQRQVVSELSSKMKKKKNEQHHVTSDEEVLVGVQQQNFEQETYHRK